MSSGLILNGGSVAFYAFSKVDSLILNGTGSYVSVASTSVLNISNSLIWSGSGNYFSILFEFIVDEQHVIPALEE